MIHPIGWNLYSFFTWRVIGWKKIVLDGWFKRKIPRGVWLELSFPPFARSPDPCFLCPVFLHCINWKTKTAVKVICHTKLTGKWTPAFKTGDAQEFKNYRPITSLIIVDKVFEQLLSKKVPEKLDHSLFQPKHATMFDWGLETRINGKEFVRIPNNQHIASIRRENIHGREERKISGHGLDYFQRWYDEEGVSGLKWLHS